MSQYNRKGISIKALGKGGTLITAVNIIPSCLGRVKIKRNPGGNASSAFAV